MNRILNLLIYSLIFRNGWAFRPAFYLYIEWDAEKSTRLAFFPTSPFGILKTMLTRAKERVETLTGKSARRFSSRAEVGQDFVPVYCVVKNTMVGGI